MRVRIGLDGEAHVVGGLRLAQLSFKSSTIADVRFACEIAPLQELHAARLLLSDSCSVTCFLLLYFKRALRQPAPRLDLICQGCLP